MTDSDIEAFTAVIAATAEMYGGKKLSDVVVALYFKALNNLSLEQVKAGISRHMQDTEAGQYMPKPADILRFHKSKKPSALIAWSEVIEAMEQKGAYISVLFQDGITNAIIRDMGGWPGICREYMTVDEPVWIQKEFERRYAEYQDSGRMSIEALTGLHDLSNINNGLLDAVKEPAFITSGQEIPKLQAATPYKQITAGANTEKIEQFTRGILKPFPGKGI